MVLIELLGTGRRAFVESYSNQQAYPRTTFVQRQAKPFSSKEEADKWARAYLPGYKWQVVQLEA